MADICLIWQVIYYRKVTLYVKLKQDQDDDVDNPITKSMLWINIIGSMAVVVLITVSCYTYYFKPFYNDHPIAYGGLSQWMGWTSAILYTGSRLPQIIKNWKQQSTEGLSSGMFICTLLGNLFFTLVISNGNKAYI